MIPQPQLAPVNPVLTAFGVAFLQSLDKFICDKVFPWRPVQNKTGRYNFYTLDDTLRDEIGELVGTSESKEVGFTKTQKTYNTRRFGGRTFENDDLLSEWSGAVTPAQAITQHLLQKGMIRCEKMWHDGFFKTGVWGTDVVGTGDDNADTGQWDRAGVDFVKRIHVACDQVEGKTGFRPNTMVIGLQAYTQIINQTFYRNLRPEDTQWTAEQRSKLLTTLGLDRLHISRAVSTTSRLGVEKTNIQTGFMAGKSALLIYVEPNPTPLTPTAGATFTTRNRMGRALGQGMGFGVYRYVDQAKHAMVVDVRANWQHKVVAPEVGIFFSNIVA